MENYTDKMQVKLTQLQNQDAQPVEWFPISSEQKPIPENSIKEIKINIKKKCNLHKLLAQTNTLAAKPNRPSHEHQKFYRHQGLRSEKLSVCLVL